MSRMMFCTISALCFALAVPALAAPEQTSGAASAARAPAVPAHRLAPARTGHAAAARARLLRHEDLARSPGSAPAFRAPVMAGHVAAAPGLHLAHPRPTPVTPARPEHGHIAHLGTHEAPGSRPSLFPSDGRSLPPRSFASSGPERGRDHHTEHPHRAQTNHVAQHQDHDRGHRHDARKDSRTGQQLHGVYVGRGPGYGNHQGADQGHGYDYGHFARREQERNWEHNYRAPHRYHWRPYVRPPGWYAEQWQFGMYLPNLFWTRNYWIEDYWNFGLPQPPYGYAWVREGEDALLVNEDDGYILQVVYGVFY